MLIKHIKPILTLMGFSLIFTELLTGNMLIISFLNPGIFILVFFVGYGIPVLIIREVVICWKGGLLSLFLLGVSYGIWNEGILAKTILLNDKVPVPLFDGYVGFLGINLPWMFFIAIWHSILAIMIPILLINFLYPEFKDKKFISTKMSKIFFSLISCVGIFLFLVGKSSGVDGEIKYLLLFVLIMTFLYFLASKLRTKLPISYTRNKFTLKPLLFGALFIVSFFLSVGIVTNLGLSGNLLILVLFAIVYLFYKLLFNYNWLGVPHIIIFGMGCYMMQGIFTIISSSILAVIFPTIAILELIIYMTLRKISKNLVT